MDYTAIKNEILTDPAHLGYAPFVAAGNDAGVAALLNAPTATLINVPSLSADTVRKLIVPVIAVFGGAGATLQAKWQPWLNLMAGVQSVGNDAEFQGLCAALVADFGPLTGAVSGTPPMDAARVTKYTQRAGTRAEVLFGAGVVVTGNDVSMALRGS